MILVNRRLLTACLLVLARLCDCAEDTFDPQQEAARHAIALEKPAVSFFEGGVLGNGGLGAIVCTRPDSILIHFGHNDVWDIRLAENNREKLVPFDELWKRITSGTTEDKEWLDRYVKTTRENYAQAYPRPWPCGSLLLSFDRRQAELIGHRVRIDQGICEVSFLVEGRAQTLEIFVDMTADRLWLRMLDNEGRPAAGPFNGFKLIPEPEMKFETWSLPDGQGFRQILPTLGNDRAKDEALALAIRVSGLVGESKPRTSSPFIACVDLKHGLASSVPREGPLPPDPTLANCSSVLGTNSTVWKAFWNRAGVRLSDELLEQIWYRNLYFLNCSVRRGAKCPGLFANWSYRKIGTAWHGDYHLNYNVQQPFWVTFSANQIEKHLPYVDLVHFLLPISRDWAQTHYRLPGAFFPHSAYPVEMTMMPYPVPTWGAEVCETPWAVQSLWWHYLYTMDQQYLRERAFGPIREAVLFLNAYLRRPEARGRMLGGIGPFTDDKYHIYPTVPPELYGMGADPAFNADCIVDLALTEFVFRAYLEACAVLAMQGSEADLMRDVRDILSHLPSYPTAESARGRVWVSVRGEKPDTVCNTPNQLAPVFPGEQVGLHSPKEQLDLALATWRNQQNEGGNELVFLNLQGARLGALDLEKFKRQVRYCQLPNGTCADMVLQSGGRYAPTTDYAYMSGMGIWFENFALPVVINECLLQSYTGELRLFPNWPTQKDAEFQDLRAVGAFLISAKLSGGRVLWVRVKSEVGGRLRLINPWPGGVVVARADSTTTMTGSVLEIPTQSGETIEFRQRQ